MLLLQLKMSGSFLRHSVVRRQFTTSNTFITKLRIKLAKKTRKTVTMITLRFSAEFHCRVVNVCEVQRRQHDQSWHSRFSAVSASVSGASSHERRGATAYAVATLSCTSASWTELGPRRLALTSPSGTLPIACVEAGAVRLPLLVHTHAGAECRRSLLKVGVSFASGHVHSSLYGFTFFVWQKVGISNHRQPNHHYQGRPPQNTT